MTSPGVQSMPVSTSIERSPAQQILRERTRPEDALDAFDSGGNFDHG